MELLNHCEKIEASENSGAASIVACLCRQVVLVNPHQCYTDAHQCYTNEPEPDHSGAFVIVPYTVNFSLRSSPRRAVVLLG